MIRLRAPSGSHPPARTPKAAPAAHRKAPRRRGLSRHRGRPEASLSASLSPVQRRAPERGHAPALLQPRACAPAATRLRSCSHAPALLQPRACAPAERRQRHRRAPAEREGTIDIDYRGQWSSRCAAAHERNVDVAWKATRPTTRQLGRARPTTRPLGRTRPTPAPLLTHAPGLRRAGAALRRPLPRARRPSRASGGWPSRSSPG
jgi:hypothetical protein